MSDTTIKVMDNGPLVIKGPVDLTDGEGNKMETKATLFLCRCGLSGHKPMCDGQHKGRFESTVRAQSEP